MIAIESYLKLRKSVKLISEKERRSWEIHMHHDFLLFF